MKTVKNLLFFMAGICLIFACTESDETLLVDDTPGSNLKSGRVPETTPARGLDQHRYVVIKDYDDLRVHYRIIGKGPIDMVLIPGWTNPLTVYTKQYEYFSDLARCIYIDLPGHGLSDAPDGIDYTMELMADAIYTVIKKEGVHKFVAVGFSWGPCVLGEFERNYPGMIQKLINIDGGFTFWPPVGDPARDVLIASIEWGYQWRLSWDMATKQWLGSILVPPDSPEELLEWVEYFWEFPSDRLANMWYNFQMEDVNQPVGWTYPILCIYKSEPNMDLVDLFFPNAEITILPGNGHVIQWAQHEEVNPLIREFISDRPGKKY
jgi:pimeloyl-ACP methyl ester carboxylesterase